MMGVSRQRGEECKQQGRGMTSAPAPGCEADPRAKVCQARDQRSQIQAQPNTSQLSTSNTHGNGCWRETSITSISLSSSCSPCCGCFALACNFFWRLASRARAFICFLYSSMPFWIPWAINWVCSLVCPGFWLARALAGSMPQLSPTGCHPCGRNGATGQEGMGI